MTHRVRLLPDAAYVNGSTLPIAYLQGLDSAQAASINGDAGGAWNPTAPIIVDGAGFWFCGPTTTSSGASVQTLPGSGKRIVHATNDVPILTPGHLLAEHIIATPILAGGTVTNGFGVPEATATLHGALGIAAIGGRIVLPIEVHELGTFTLAVLHFLANTHASLPAQMPQMRVYAVDAFGDVFPLGGTPGSAGYVPLPRPASVAAYSGLAQFLQYPIDAGVVIDKLHFTYFAEIIDESGAGFVDGNAFEFVRCSFESIGSLYFP